MGEHSRWDHVATRCTTSVALLRIESEVRRVMLSVPTRLKVESVTRGVGLGWILKRLESCRSTRTACPLKLFKVFLSA